MKAKSTVPEKGKRLESPKVELSQQSVAEAKQDQYGIDLEELHGLFEVNETLEKLFRTDPSAVECEDESDRAYMRACALLAYTELAAKGWEADHTQPDGQMAGLVMDSIRIQLDIVRLAGKRLFSMCHDHESREAVDSHNT